MCEQVTQPHIFENSSIQLLSSAPRNENSDRRKRKGIFRECTQVWGKGKPYVGCWDPEKIITRKEGIQQGSGSGSQKQT